MSSISGLTIIRNAITNGYPIAEVIDTLQSICDEVIVCDGMSDDGTIEYLRSRTDIKLFQDDWDLQSNNGLEFAKITNLGLSRCTGDYVLYLQADELIHEKDMQKLKALINSNKYRSINCKFTHIRYDFKYCLTSGYDKAIRVIRNDGAISSLYDGFSFEGQTSPTFESDIYIYHFGYVFIENILQKMINHAECFYVDAANYNRRKVLSQAMLEQIRAGKHIEPLEAQMQLEPEYQLVEHHLPIPACMQRLQSVTRYILP